MSPVSAELPETFVGPDEFGVWTDGTATIGCWAWRDATIPVEGVTASQIKSTWMTQWNDWGYDTMVQTWPFLNVNGYDDSDIWTVFMTYETPEGDHDLEVREPHANLVDGDVFIECSARILSPTEEPLYSWWYPLIEVVTSVTIVDRDAILTNTWGTERGDY